jgi:hypothetical protein
MSLEEIVDNSRTDKNTIHSYLGLYETLLNSKKTTAQNVLEVGIYAAGSIKLWRDYFVNSTVHGLDIMSIDQVWEGVKNDDRIVLHTSMDAYDNDNFTKLFLDKNIKFDMVLDDGPHSLESMRTFIKLYSQVLTEDGILIIEDVQSWQWIETLINEVPDDLKKYIQTFDLRANKGRYDDIVFVINKTNLNNYENMNLVYITKKNPFIE